MSTDYLLGRDEDLAGASPIADALFRDFARMTHDDQESVAEMAKILARKNRPKSKDPPDDAG